MSEWWVYLLRCADDSLYAGATTDLQRRLDQHNNGSGARYTRSRRPVRLVYREGHPTQSEAFRREAALKAMSKSKKEELVASAPGPGTLYLVGTPIGNLEDITARALRILREAAVIAAEDTRQTRKLLSHFDIHTPLVSYHEHNEATAAPALIGRLQAGEDVAVVSDAGMPGISDPGLVLVQLAAAAGLPVVPVPGPSAALAALVASGLPTREFAFVGFLPRGGKARQKALRQLVAEQRTLILYEAPHRLLETLADLAQHCGFERPACVARELTKLFEEFQRGTLRELIEHFQAQAPRGECTLLLGAAPAAAVEAAPAAAAADVLAAAVADLEAGGTGRKEAMKQVARAHGLSKEAVYAAVLQYRDANRPEPEK